MVDEVIAIQRFALDNAGNLLELDVNPVIVRPAGHGAVAVDAFIAHNQRKPDMTDNPLHIKRNGAILKVILDRPKASATARWLWTLSCA